MNTLLNQIENELISVLSNIEKDINIDFHVSKLENFDLQINSFIKYRNSENFDEISKITLNFLNNKNIFSNVEITQQGFINLSLNPLELIKTIRNTADEFKVENPKNMIIDYGGPNIGKPLHVGHIRTLNIGKSIYNMNKFISNNIKSDIHLGDWGMPVAQIITFIKHNNLNIEDITAEDLQY